MKDTLSPTAVNRYVKNGMPNTIYTELHYLLLTRFFGSQWVIITQNNHGFIGRWIVKYKK